MSMRLIGSILAAAALLLFAAPAAAITNGDLDGAGHPHVGMTGFQVAGLDILFPLCTGTLIAPDLYLTAAHCSDFLQFGLQQGFITAVRVTFHPSFFAAGPGDFVDVASIHINPDWFSGSAGGLTVTDNGDIAVYRLAAPVPGVTPAALPPAGLLDDLRVKNGLHGQPFKNVGFGNQVFFDHSRPSFGFDGRRRVSYSDYRAVAPGYLILSQNDNTGDGGTCFGDSGGPIFLGDSDLVVALSIQGDAMCRATNVVYRLDTPGARAFLGGLLTLP